MTTPEPTTEAPVSGETPAETADAATATEAEPEVVDDKGEAAKYRRRLRDTETERDGLAERLTNLQRAEAERLAADVLAAGPDLWLGGTQLSDLLDDTGSVDIQKVTAAARLVTADRPHWRRREPSAAAASDVTGNGKITSGDEPRSWADVLGGQNTK